MKRIAQHVCFWAFYLANDTLLAFSWKSSYFQTLPDSERLAVSFKLCLAVWPPKILFVYFVLYVVLPRILKKGRYPVVPLLYGLAAAAATLILVRTVDVFVVYPFVYNRAVPTPAFFQPFGFLFNLIDLGWVSGMAIAIRQVRLQSAAKDREKLLLKEKLETELKYLRSQTNPHFLFNTLNNIYGLARRKSDDTADVVMKLSKLLRFTLYESGKPVVKIADELQMLDDYIRLESIRHTKNLSVKFEKQVDDETEEIAPLLLLPFVENAFKHGAGENRFECYVHLTLCLCKGRLIFTVENSREEGPAAAVTGSIGLSNVKRQLQLMYDEHRLEVLNGPSAFNVVLHVNLRSRATL